MTATRICAVFAVLASVAVPLFVRADPPQSAVAGLVLPAGTSVGLVLEQSVDSSSIAPGAVIQSHLARAVVVGGNTVAPTGARVMIAVTGTRRSSSGIDGEVSLHVGALRLSSGDDLPLALPHYALSPPVVAANPGDVTLPAPASAQARGIDLVLPAGTTLRAVTTASLDASDPQKLVVVSPPPFTTSTDTPYAAFTAIPVATYNPLPQQPRRPRGRAAPRPSPSPSPAPVVTPSPEPVAT